MRNFIFGNFVRNSVQKIRISSNSDKKKTDTLQKDSRSFIATFINYVTTAVFVTEITNVSVAAMVTLITDVTVVGLLPNLLLSRRCYGCVVTIIAMVITVSTD
jgi:hypothetical protein